MTRTTLLKLAFSGTMVLALASTTRSADPTRPIDFDQTVAALLATRCLDCHSGTSPKGGLDLTTHGRAIRGGETGPAFVSGRLDTSLAWKRVVAGEMPPKNRLSKNEQAVLKQWILQGARWGTDPIDRFRYTTTTRAGTDWWSLQPLTDPKPPSVSKKKWPRGDLDRFILARLTAQRLSPTAPATPRQLIRRLHIDLVGLPPDPGTVADFVAKPTDATYAELVDRLLASPEYGERWGRHWLDVVRFGESNGFERNGPRKNFWPAEIFYPGENQRPLPPPAFLSHGRQKFFRVVRGD